MRIFGQGYQDFGYHFRKLAHPRLPKLPIREIVVQGIPSDQIDIGALGLQDGCTSNIPGHGSAIRKGCFHPPSPGERVREHPCVGHLQSRLSGRQPGPYACAPPPRPSDVRRRRLCIWLLVQRGLCVPWRAPILHNRGGQLCEEHHCADIYRRSRVHGDGPRWHYLWPHTGKHRPHNRNPRQRRRRRHPSDSLQIKYDTDKKAQAKWRELYPDTEPAGLFVAKVDVSEIPMGLQASLPAFIRLLLAHGYGIYCIDYTQDFSGVLDREMLVDHLCASEGFREQGDLASSMRTDVPTILANTDSVGGYVCTWVHTSKLGTRSDRKAYNKVVSNFEAGEIREPIGDHLADYVDCPNDHLRRTFLHPDIQAWGCTCIEVSLYACRRGDLSANTAKEVVEEALAPVSPLDLPGLFVVQLPAKQWENQAACLNRCPRARYLSPCTCTTTGRVSGVWVRPTKANVDK